MWDESYYRLAKGWSYILKYTTILRSPNRLFKQRWQFCPGTGYFCDRYQYEVQDNKPTYIILQKCSINPYGNYVGNSSLIGYPGLSRHPEKLWVKRCRQAKEMWLYLSLLLLPSLANKYFSNCAIILRSVGERAPSMLTWVPTSALLLKISLSSSRELTSVSLIPTQPLYPVEICFVF